MDFFSRGLDAEYRSKGIIVQVFLMELLVPVSQASKDLQQTVQWGLATLSQLRGGKLALPVEWNLPG